MSNGTHSVSFVSEGGLPEIVSPGDDDEDDDQGVPGDDDDGEPQDNDDDQDDDDDEGNGHCGDDDHDDHDDHDDDDHGAPAPAPSGRGTSGNDHLDGTPGADVRPDGPGARRLEGRGGDVELSRGTGGTTVDRRARPGRTRGGGGTAVARRG